ncbi:hypothetical protein HQQ80_10135 [Microbacteriaceae bacterium VKM Ac-2855]|nr:hypothetical protein [Microbacteriaceae bacterium VKM Ac-2855]
MTNYIPAPIEIGDTFHSGAFNDPLTWRVIGVYAQVVIADSVGGKRRSFSRSFVTYRLSEELAHTELRAG